MSSFVFRKNDESTADAHEEFMATYKSIFVRPEPKKGFPIHSLHRRYVEHLTCNKWECKLESRLNRIKMFS